MPEEKYCHVMGCQGIPQADKNAELLVRAKEALCMLTGRSQWLEACTDNSYEESAYCDLARAICDIENISLEDLRTKL